MKRCVFTVRKRSHLNFYNFHLISCFNASSAYVSYYSNTSDWNCDLNHQSGPNTMKTVHYMSNWAHPSSILSRKPRSVTAEFKRDGEIDFRGKGACLCVSLGNVLGAPRRMDIKTHTRVLCRHTSTPVKLSNYIASI